jgi:hypothetical protein
MEKIAQIFFDQNYVNKNKKNKKLEVEKEKTEINIFNKGVIEEIEIDILPQKKKFYTGFNSFDKDTSFFDNISNINPFPKSQLNLNELKDFKINQSNNNYIVDSESTLSNSINSILSILTTKKEKIKINYLNNKNNDKDNNIFNDNKNNNNNNTIHLINNNYVNNNINMRNNSMNYKTISNVFQTPKKKTNYISSNSSLKNSKIKSYKKISEKKGLVSQLTNNVISSSNFHSNYNIDYRRSFHTKYSSQYFNEQIEIKKTSSNNKIKSPSNLKNTFSNNNSKKDTNKNVRNILKVLSQNENNTSPLKNNIKTPIDFYLTQSKLFKSPTNDLRESERKKSNLKSSRNSKNIVFNFQNSSKKIIKKSSIEDSTISIQSRNLLRNSHNNINKLIHNSGKKNNIINNNFSSGHKNNQILTKKGKLIFPNKEISTRANSNDYNLIKPQISLLTFC